MGVTVVLTCPVVTVAADGLMRSQLFKPALVILVEAGLIIINKDGGCNVHCIDQDQSLTDTALPQTRFDFRCDINKGPSPGDV